MAGPTRRGLLQLATLVPGLAMIACSVEDARTPDAPPLGRGEPFADGTWFDDGFGWVE